MHNPNHNQDIKEILTEEQYKELIDAKRADLEEEYAGYGLTDEKLQKEIQKEIDGTSFEIGMDEQGRFVLKEFFRYGVSIEINPDEIDETKLAMVVEKAMQKHLD